MYKVLVVDDAAFMRATLKNMLEKNGYLVIGEAENGNDCIEKYKDLQPDIITLDITMPEKDGLQTLKELKQLNSLVKVIMISAMGQEGLVKDAIISGAKSFIVKPFKEETVVNALKKILG